MTYNEVKNCLFQIPPIFPAPSEITFSLDQVAKIAYEYAEASWEESVLFTDELDFSYEGYLSWCNKEQEQRVIPGLHSTYLHEVMDYLLIAGADPNYISTGDWSLMEQVGHTVNGYVAADTLKLLLERGGDPNLVVDNETVFESFDFDVWYDMNGQIDRRAYDSLVHCWMVLIGFGGVPVDGRMPVYSVNEWTPRGSVPFNSRKLREHQNYSFAISYATNKDSSPTLHLFDKRTYWEVARR